MMDDLNNRYSGAMLGLACGDAVGCTGECFDIGMTTASALQRYIVNGNSFGATVLAAANLGDDADTVAALAGQLAGAFYGASAIPERWLRRLAMRQEIERLALELARSASSRQA